MKKKELEEKVQGLEAQLHEANQEACKAGLMLQGEVFIPEYLGFAETVVEEKGLVTGRIYTKKGYNISRPVDTSHPEWIVLSPKGVSSVVMLEDIYTAIIVLRACGMDISLEDYYEEGSKRQKAFEEHLSEEESEQF